MSRRIVLLVTGVLLLAAQLPLAAGVSAQGGILHAKLTGSHEVPAAATGATGHAQVIPIGGGSQIFYQVVYSGLSGPAVAAHIHLGGIGANGPVLFPLKVASGVMVGNLGAGDFSGAGNLTYAQAVDAIRSGGTYVNVHTAKYPAGEIRGQIYDPDSTDYTITADWAAGIPQGQVWTYNDYFPRALTVARGSTIRFDIQGFHTGTLLPAGMTVLDSFRANGIIAPDDDPEDNANGTTGVFQNFGAIATILPTETCGSDAEPCEFDGTNWLSVGPNFGPPAPGAAIEVTAPTGTYWFHCLIHPTQIGRLNVVASPTDPQVSSPDDVAVAVAAQAAAEMTKAERADAAVERVTYTSHANGSRTWNAWAGYDVGLAAVLEFPKEIRIKSGDRVRWNINSRNEPHTVAFALDPSVFTVVVCETGDTEVPATPVNVPPQGPGDFSCPGGGDLQFEAGGGNGVRAITSPSTESDSGVITTASYLRLQGVPTTAGLRSWTVSFKGAEPGTYSYICTIHEGMAGKIIVE